MKNVLIEDAEPGMVLHDPVNNFNGKVLLPGGVELTDKHLRALKQWGILEINIVADEGAEVVNISPEVIAESEAVLKPLFVHTDLEQPLMQEIFNQAVLYHVRSHSQSS